MSTDTHTVFTINSHENRCMPTVLVLSHPLLCVRVYSYSLVGYQGSVPNGNLVAVRHFHVWGIGLNQFNMLFYIS